MNRPEDLGTIIKELERRIRVLETTPRLPVLSVPTRRAVSQYEQTSSGTFSPQWEGFIGRITHDALQVELVVHVPSGSVGQIRLFESATASHSASQTVNFSASTQRFTWNWAPGWPVGATGNVMMQVQSRLVSGAGPVTVYQPDIFDLVGSGVISATATGV